MISIIIADDDSVVRQGLSMILSAEPDFELIASAEHGREAVDLCRRHNPQVTVLDIRMPVMDGIDAAEIILNEGLSAPLLLTTFDEPELMNRAIKVGAAGYILKNSPAGRIISAIKTVASGGAVFAPDVLDYLRKDLPRKESPDFFAGLTPRELEVVKLVAGGLSNSEIAARLYLADGTVRNHISTILEKTGLTHRTQIAVKYLV